MPLCLPASDSESQVPPCLQLSCLPGFLWSVAIQSSLVFHGLNRFEELIRYFVECLLTWVCLVCFLMIRSGLRVFGKDTTLGGITPLSAGFMITTWLFLRMLALITWLRQLLARLLTAEILDLASFHFNITPPAILINDSSLVSRSMFNAFCVFHCT